ncbi:hypothetical protein FJT64_016905 [Amphibalanus amphitrite]|uniref:Uncharacterized protein n=1 Tax=Amphibalanus amphitrite TaxID=1232801 RepID=A0A6A4X806_AMPAM|nr:hypothetical protein FJT64_016905 [Amphibalanus amphitrite]
MKVSVCLLLAVAGVVCSSDQGPDQPQPETPPAQPETPPAQPETPPAQPETPPAQPETRTLARQGWRDRLAALFKLPNRRQGIAGLLGGIGPVGAVVGVVGATVAVATAVAVTTQLTEASGKGLDTSEWEIDYSVWSDMLQKDFDDSWSTT